MPAIIPRENYSRWLAPALRDPTRIQTMIASYPAGELQAIAPGARINTPATRGRS